jgi:hypothetical protein
MVGEMEGGVLTPAQLKGLNGAVVLACKVAAGGS